MATEKKCTKCGEVKPLASFHKRKTSPDGINTQCKQCGKADRKERKSYERRTRGYKNCRRCGNRKHVKEFGRNRLCLDGLHGTCRECHNADSRARPKQEIATEGNRKCKQCNTVKPLTDFHADPKGTKGRRIVCISCVTFDRRKKHNSRKASGWKTCNECGENKHVSQYHSQKNHSDGLSGKCNVCTLRRQKRINNPPRTEGKKYCKRCKAEKPVADFGKHKGSSDGLNGYCKACCNEIRSARAEKVKPRTTGNKKCSECGKIKSVNAFGLTKNFKDGRTAKCKKCLNAEKKVFRYESQTEGTKCCFVCNEEKHITEFWKDCRRKDGRHSQCKACLKAKARNADFPRRKRGKKVCIECKEKKSVKEFGRDKGKQDGLCIRCRDCMNMVNNERYPTDREVANRWRRDAMKHNPDFRISTLLRNRLRSALDAVRADRHVSAIHCGLPSSRDLSKHLEAQFEEGMTFWNIQIDHWMPLLCKEVDLHNPIHQRAVCHYTNLRPMWPKLNGQKHNKVYKAAYKNFLRLVALFEAEEKGAA